MGLGLGIGFILFAMIALKFALLNTKPDTQGQIKGTLKQALGGGQ